MNIIDVLAIAIIVLFVIIGYKRGVIKTVVQFVGLCAVIVIAYTFKDLLGGLLMEYLPFFDLPGSFHGITAINVLIYNFLAFMFIFIIFYCILNIILSFSGLIDKIVNLTVILEKPSKILGGIVGLIEGTIVSFLVVFTLFHVSFTQPLVGSSKLGIIIMERTPIIAPISVQTTLALEEINNVIVNASEDENPENINFKVINKLIYYKIITSEKAQDLVDNKKIRFTDRVTF